MTPRWPWINEANITRCPNCGAWAWQPRQACDTCHHQWETPRRP